MSVKILDFATYEFIHEEAGHHGTLDPLTLTYKSNLDGSTSHNFIEVTCPTCGMVSSWPAGGGADPVLGQTLFVTQIEANSCPCGTLADLTHDVALAHAKLHCAQMDGLDRWQIEANSGPMVNILVNDATDYVCGLGPIDPDTIPSSYVTESTLTRLGLDLELVLANTYTKVSGGKVVKADKP